MMKGDEINYIKIHYIIKANNILLMTTDMRIDDKLDKYLNNDLIEKVYSHIIYNYPKELLEDIQDFYNKKNEILNIYTKKFSHEPDEVLNWIENDLLAFYNNDIALMNCFTNNFRNLFRRKYKYNNYDDNQIDKYCTSLMSKDVKYIINILLSNMNKKERDCFIEYAYKQ